MKLVGKIVLVFVIIIMVILIGLYVKAYWPHKIHFDQVVGCVYHYEYFNEADAICQDTVEITFDDAQKLVGLITEKPFREAIDLEKGFTTDYALDFLNENGETIRILIQYGRHGRIRLDKTNWDYVLDEASQKEFYSILEGYHRHDGVLLAG